ncbi:hypothetical protein ACSBR2_023133 [Camellia fascicularis]
MLGKPMKHFDFDGDDDVMLAMMVQLSSLEEQIATLAKVVETLGKCDQKQETQLTKLLNKLKKKPICGATKLLGSMPKLAKQTTPQEILETSSKSMVSSEDIQVSADGLIHAKQLKDLIMGATTKKDASGCKTFQSYTKPYTHRIELVKIPRKYQPPKFPQFNSKDDPKQHVVHFVETCSNTRPKKICWSSNSCIV